jgi:hypothetical protein
LASRIEIEKPEKKEILLSDLYMDYKNSEISQGLSEDEIRKNVTEIYTKVNSEFGKNFSKHGDKAFFNINGFLDGVMTKMHKSMTVARKYDSKTINKIMEVPYRYKEELLRITMYFYLRVQEYKGIIEYKSNMLPYSYILNPTSVEDDFDEDKYFRNLQFAKDYNIASKFSKATKLLVRDDVYFAYEMTDSSGKNFLWKTLPSEYCTILGRDRFETYRVGFNMNYFVNFPEDLDRFPPEFKKLFSDYQNSKKQTKKKGVLNPLDYEDNAIYELDNTKAIAFKFDESVDFVLPYFSGMFMDLIRLSELKDVEILSAISDNYKLIHQEIPMSKESGQEDDFMLSGEFMDIFHKNLRDNVPEGIGVATTPMKVSAITLKSNVGSAEENIVTKHVSNLMTQSGTSTLMFNGNSTSALGLNKNIQMDENSLFKLLRQYELFMNKRLFLFNKNTYKFNLKFLDHTYYNTEDLHARYLKNGQYGMMQVFELAAVSGVQQIDFINNMKVVGKLGILDMMKPLSSSHVQDGSNSDEVGGKKTEKELSDDGAKSRERDL